MTRYGTGVWTEEGRRPIDTDENGIQLPYVGILDGIVELTDAAGNVTYEKNTKAVSGQDYWASRAYNRIGEEFILDASYIILRELVLSYNFSNSILNKTPLKNLTINLFGRNLLYLEEHMKGTGISPESGPNTSAWAQGVEVHSLPATRTFGASIHVAF